EELPLGHVRRNAAAEGFGEGRELDFLHPTAPPACEIETRMDGQAVEPGVEPLRVAQPGQIAPGSDEGVLDRVSRELAIPEDQSGGGVQARYGSAGDRGKRAQLAAPRS